MTAVRAATRADLPRCREIQTAALAEPWPDLLPTALETDAVFLVLTDPGDDELLGYAVALAATDEPAYLPEFAVHPDRQGEGHGSTLMQALLATLAERGHDTVRLTVQASDERARGFYESRGFVVRERRPDHYEADDGLLLERSLGDFPDSEESDGTDGTVGSNDGDRTGDGEGSGDSDGSDSS